MADVNQTNENQSEERSVQLLGRIFLRGDIKAVTGLHIGGAAGNLEIGGVDSPVIRDPLSGRPFIPGSSIKGKLRSLSERLHGKRQNFQIGRTRGKEVFIHTCEAGKLPQRNPSDEEGKDTALAQWQNSYQQIFSACEVCSIFGVTGDEPVPHPTALVVRDTFLGDESAVALDKARTDMPFTEIKWEATIDRVTSAATPRQIERVPAGAIFKDFELVYNVYSRTGEGHFKHLLTSMILLEEDYLGGLGSRGGGKIQFDMNKVYVRKGSLYQEDGMPLEPGSVAERRDEIEEWVRSHFPSV
ncbi:MAG: type III-A CRISPR-associated RAMP protein Csm3 [Chloroflexota bacterium]